MMCYFRLLDALSQLAVGYPLLQNASAQSLQITFGSALYSVNPESFSGLSVSLLLGNSFNFKGISTKELVFEERDGATASVRLTDTLFTNLTLRNNETKVIFSVYLNEGFFP